jgi:hypothetical protein
MVIFRTRQSPQDFFYDAADDRLSEVMTPAPSDEINLMKFVFCI